jgi:hypothetical protein
MIRKRADVEPHYAPWLEDPDTPDLLTDANPICFTR